MGSARMRKVKAIQEVEANMDLNEGKARNTCSDTRLENSADEGAAFTTILLVLASNTDDGPW